MNCLNRQVFRAENVYAAAYFRSLCNAAVGSSRVRSANFVISFGYFGYFVKADRTGRWRDIFPECCGRLHWEDGGALLFPINVPVKPTRRESRCGSHRTASGHTVTVYSRFHSGRLGSLYELPLRVEHGTLAGGNSWPGHFIESIFGNQRRWPG